jgi:1-acyl-sn-glycerol-3-phosphate acyltransferase
LRPSAGARLALPQPAGLGVDVPRHAGAAVLVHPSGDSEAHRPVWQGHRIDFHGRHGFIRLVLETGAPLVRVVAIGGQETTLFLSRGARLARARRLPEAPPGRAADLDRAPVGPRLGDAFGHLPLPARITIEVPDPIDVAARFGDDVDRAYDEVVARMQRAVDRLAAARRWPVLG